jgi:hypothetical protein
VPARDAADIVLTASLMAPKALATSGSLIRTSAVRTVTASPIAACRHDTARRFFAKRPRDRQQRQHAERRLQL